MTTETQAPAPGTYTPVVETPAGAPAPAPAPAAKVDPAPAPEAKVELPVNGEAGDKPGTFEYAPTEHAGLDAALAFVGKHGFGPEHPAIKAAINGDFSLLRAQLSEKGAPGADAYVLLAENAYKEIGSKEAAKREADQTALHEYVGGKEQWEAITAWGKTNAEPAEQEAINKMLAKGGTEMKIAAGFLASAYQRSTGGIPETDGAGPGVSDVRGAPSAGAASLSPKEYGSAVEKARLAHRGSEPFESTQVYAKLREQRGRFKG